MKKILVFGSSGHARSIAVILEELNYEIVGFIDSFIPEGEKILDYKTVGNENVLKSCLRNFGTNEVVVAIGDNLGRRRVVEKIKYINSSIIFPTIISSTAKVSKYTSIGMGTVVFNKAFVNVECEIGEFCVINSSSIVEHNTSIKRFCHISPGVNIGGHVKIDENTFVGLSSSIIQKRNIGSNTVIGAGSIVISDIPDRVLAVGIPAVVKKVNYRNKNLYS